MSGFSINGTSSRTDAASLSIVPPIRPVADGDSGGVAETGASDEDSVSIDTMPAGPPPEVMAAIGAASDAFDELADQGRHISFSNDPVTGAFTMQLQDTDGTVLSALKPSQVLDLACGDATDQTRKSADVHLQRQFGD